jgi:hypothetical protein
MSYCINCGQIIRKGATFCTNCGARIYPREINQIQNNFSESFLKSGFKKVYIFYFLLGVLLIFTNPSEDKHEYAVSLRVSSALRSKYDNGSIFSELGITFGEGIASMYIKDKVSSQNLILFSLTRINGSICGIGIFDAVYLSPRVNKIINSSIENY